MGGLGDKPAFPGEMEVQNPNGPNVRYPVPGMTYREAVAKDVMAGFATLTPYNDLFREIDVKAKAAVEWAGALIVALEKK